MNPFPLPLRLNHTVVKVCVIAGIMQKTAPPEQFGQKLKIL